MTIKWNQCADLPTAVALPSIVRIGDYIYVGGGLRRGYDAIMKYRISQDTWTTLPNCPTYEHGLATLNGELVAIGGTVLSKATNRVYTFRDGRWLEDLPPMPTPRCNLSTVSHQDRFIIAAGGTQYVSPTGKRIRTSRVEVYVKEKNQWYSTRSLPFPMAVFSTCIVNDVFYTVGGVGEHEQSRTTLYASLSSLLRNTSVEHSTPAPQITWKQLSSQHPLFCASPAAIDGRLIAFGGYSTVELHCADTLVSTYDFFSHRWVKLADAQLPVPLYRPGVITLDNDKLMIIGGQPKSQQFSPSVFIGSFTWLNATYSQLQHK